MAINGSGNNDDIDRDRSEPQLERSSDGFAADTLNLISEHKGKLAMGAAAALGLMILYNWREKSLAEEDPEAYARLQKFTAPFKSPDEIEQEEFERRMREREREQQGGSLSS